MEFDFDMDFLKSLISDFDLMALLPDMADVMEWIATAVSYAVVAGPVLLMAMGLWYLILPTKEANHFVGYRFFWGMGSIKSWRFTQRFAGAVWAIMGLVLALKANDLRVEMADLEKLDMMYQAIELILNQIGCVIISVLAINVFIFILFNFKGEYRKIWRNLVAFIKSSIEKGKQNKAKKPKAGKRVRPNSAQSESVQNNTENL